MMWHTLAGEEEGDHDDVSAAVAGKFPQVLAKLCTLGAI